MRILLDKYPRKPSPEDVQRAQADQAKKEIISDLQKIYEDQNKDLLQEWMKDKR